MRALSLCPVGSLLVFLSADLSAALQIRNTYDLDIPDWNSGEECQVSYYNTCNGWIYGYSYPNFAETVGVSFDACCSNAVLKMTRIFMLQGAGHSGYGFTGTIMVNVPQCSGPYPYPVQEWLPVAGDNVFYWDVPVPSGGVDVWATVGGSRFPGPGAPPNPAEIAADHPGAGPTGPSACGNCYSRPVGHTVRWSDWTGECRDYDIDDGCPVEFVFDAAFFCPVHTEATTWGRLKSLYR